MKETESKRNRDPRGFIAHKVLGEKTHIPLSDVPVGSEAGILASDLLRVGENGHLTGIKVLPSVRVVNLNWHVGRRSTVILRRISPTTFIVVWVDRVKDEDVPVTIGYQITLLSSRKAE